MITFIYSTVNAGKSANLIMRAHSCGERGLNYQVLVPLVAAQRDEVSKVASRIGFTMNAISLATQDCPFEVIQSQVNPLQVVFVDEAQFLTKKQVLGLARISDELRIPVFAYGLRTDFKGEPFEGSTYLMAWSDNIEEISTFSVPDHLDKAERATFNMKVDSEGKRIAEGDSVSPGFGYLPVSRRVFFRT